MLLFIDDEFLGVAAEVEAILQDREVVVKSQALVPAKEHNDALLLCGNNVFCDVYNSIFSFVPKEKGLIQSLSD
jgi:hypothetical protein